MSEFSRHGIRILLFCGCAIAAPRLEAAFTHFEARHCHPIDHTPDGRLLLAVNAPEGRLSVFSTTHGGDLPMLIAEIPVGLEPVSVRARSNTEAWVVNEVSDTVSVVDLAAGRVVATLAVGDEPADVVFTGGKAFVSCARDARIAVMDAVARTLISTIPLEGLFPRQLALSPDGSRLYAAFLLSGNKTTTLHFRSAPEPPAPTNPALPPAPQTALIVPDSDPRISYQVVDHDIAEIDTATSAVVRYHGSVGTNILSLDCSPDGLLWVGATEARNLIRFEPNLNGIFQESRLARIGGSSITLQDLNPQAGPPKIGAQEKAGSLAQPMALLTDREGAWLAAFGSDRVARVSNSGEILARVELRTTAPEMVRGPRGLARNPASGLIVVLNKLSSTLSVIHPDSAVVLGEIPLASHQPIPADQLRGRGRFYDARISGNGTVSCGSCHFDADIDGVAWDLGDPGGNMLTVTGYSPAIGQPGPVDRILHPMKGPMVTQSLRGLAGSGPFHWRGDKTSIQEFNSSFSQLQAGEQLPVEEMDEVAAYIESLSNHPNPNRLPDNSLPSTLNGADPAQGKIRFEQLNVCSKCHAGPRGTNHLLDDFPSVLTRQPVKNATLEHVYRKVHYTPDQGVSLSGFGFTHDGTGHDFPRGHEYPQDRFHLYPNAAADVMAYILCTETGTRPAVGTTSQTPSTVLENQATLGNCDLIAHAIIGGERRTFLFRPAAATYQPDTHSEICLTAAQLTTTASSVEFTGVPLGNGVTLSIDRDGDGILNRDAPAPKLTLNAFLQPVSTPKRTDWFIESSRDLEKWLPAASSPPVQSKQFFRLHRTW